ncbi:hypothetical protein EJB05_44746, partial [Eragrostis curvula]
MKQHQQRNPKTPKIPSHHKASSRCSVGNTMCGQAMMPGDYAVPAASPRRLAGGIKRKKCGKVARDGRKQWEAAFREFMNGDSDDDDIAPVLAVASRRSCSESTDSEAPQVVPSGKAVVVRPAKQKPRQSAPTTTAARPSDVRRKQARRRSCPYHGIRQRLWGRWASEIRDPVQGVRLWLGTFDSAVDAARAYDAEARRIYGARAKTNFPRSGDGKASRTSTSTEAEGSRNSSDASAPLELECCSDDVLDSLLAGFSDSGSTDNWGRRRVSCRKHFV